MKKERILVCGATGFIGRNVVERLSKRDDVEVYGTYFNSEPPEYAGVKMIKANLTNKADVERVMSDMNVVIQAAATTSGAMEIVNKPYYHVTDNALMNSLILRAAYEKKVSHLVFFSCTVMYQSADTPINDSAVKEGDFDANKEIFPGYFGVGWTKVYIEKMCEFYSRIGGTKHTVIRHSNIYGPYDKYDLVRSHVFGATMTKVMKAEDNGKLAIWGSGEEERDLLYVSDLVDFVELAMKKQETRYELYNVGYGSSIPVNDLVRKIVEQSGKKVTLEHDLSKPSLKTKIFLDITKARENLGWAPSVSLDEGVRKTMGWYVKNIDISTL